MPLFFDISDAYSTIENIESPELRAIYRVCEPAESDSVVTMADVIPAIKQFGDVWLALQPFDGNWFCLNGEGLQAWTGSQGATGRFLTEIQNADLHRFFTVLETVRRTKRSMLVRHCNETDGDVTFWDSLVVTCRHHRLLDEHLYFILSKRRQIGNDAVRNLFEDSPIAQIIVLPLHTPQKATFDAYIIEANERARHLFNHYQPTARGRRLRDEIELFNNETGWKSLIEASERNEEWNTRIGDTQVSIHIQRMSGYWVIHLIETGTTAITGTLSD